MPLNGRKRTKATICATDYFHKVGRINATAAKKAGIQKGDIVVDADALQHIEERHGKQLEQLGMNAELFVKTIAANFNQIRKGSGISYLLVVFDNDSELHFTAAIQLNYSVKNGFWEVATAQPRRTSSLKNNKLLYEK